MKRIVHGISETALLAAEIASQLRGGGVLALHGDLGAGKTTFIQCFARALGITRPVTSPTFALVSEFALPESGRLVHMDLYRLGGPEDLDGIGFEDYFTPGTIVAIEWPDRAEGALPPETRNIRFKIIDETTREIEWQ